METLIYIVLRYVEHAAHYLKHTFVANSVGLLEPK